MADRLEDRVLVALAEPVALLVLPLVEWLAVLLELLQTLAWLALTT